MTAGSTSAPAAVQVFGRRDSADTRRAQRFFRERRVDVSFVDLVQRPMARTELRRFAARFGATSLFDRGSRAYRDAGLAYLAMDDEEALERALADQRLLRLPLVRFGTRLSVGVTESDWQDWLAQSGS